MIGLIGITGALANQVINRINQQLGSRR